MQLQWFIRHIGMYIPNASKCDQSDAVILGETSENVVTVQPVAVYWWIRWLISESDNSHISYGQAGWRPIGPPTPSQWTPAFRLRPACQVSVRPLSFRASSRSRPLFRSCALVLGADCPSAFLALNRTRTIPEIINHSHFAHAEYVQINLILVEPSVVNLLPKAILFIIAIRRPTATRA
jgi:hypothetical protein